MWYSANQLAQRVEHNNNQEIRILTSISPHPVGMKASTHTTISSTVMCGSAIKVIRIETKVTNIKNLNSLKMS
jgi:hypothetical protein